MTAQHYLLFTLGLYAVGALDMLVQAVARRRLLTSWTVTATLVGFALHTASLSQRWRDAGHFPAVGLHDATSILAWAIVLVFLVVYVRTRVEALGLFAYPVAFGLVLISNLTPAAENADPILRSLFLPIHAALAFFGYAALFLAFAMGILYLVQERELKSRSPRAFYYLAPSLERCDTISGRSVAVGFGFLTLAIATGMLWSHSAHGRYWTGDAKEWAALAGWTLYVALLAARLRNGWGGRRAALLGIAGFAAVVFMFVWMTVFSAPVGAAP
ncbi:MAG TPA: cytochrome c biogenesis protein CcsA [Vicinamibacteria bacterium]|jgi:cytochrome c-type biogenesis protein CcsB